jgi:chromate transporter
MIIENLRKNLMVDHPPSLPTLFLAFLRLGITAFGGPAMIAYIRKMAVEDRKWISPETFRNGVALCQTIPGATAMQVTAYVGLRVGGIAGAAASFIGFGLPAFCLMVILSFVYVHTQSLPQIISAFNGLRVIIVALVANAAFAFGRSNVKNWQGLLIAIIIGLAFALGVNPILVILLAAGLGMVLYHNQTFDNPASHPASRNGIDWKPILILGVFIAGMGALWLIDRGLFDLTGLMSKIDLLAFGGGFTSIPLMSHEIVDARSWLSNAAFMDGIALGQITPGPIVITATFVGFLYQGLAGAVFATIGIFLPSFLMVVGITPHFDSLQSHANFRRAVEGVLSSFVGLLVYVTYRFALGIPWDIPRMMILVGALAALLLKRDILWVVLIGAVISAIAL